MNTPPTITIPNDRFTHPLLHLVATSALAGCTTVGYDGGVQVVKSDRPIALLSTGERALWDALDSLCAGSLRELLTTADSLTVAALADFFARAVFASSTRMPEASAS